MKKAPAIALIVFVAIFAALWGGGCCLGLSLAYGPHLVLRFGNVEAGGTRGVFSFRARCSYLLAGTPSEPLDASLGLEVMLEDGTVLVLDGTPVPTLVSAKHAPLSAHNQSLGWPQGTRDAYLGPGLEVLHVDGTPLQVFIRATDGDRRVRTARHREWVTLPCSQSDAKRLFGEPLRAGESKRKQ